MLHKNNSIEINGCMNVKRLIGCLISVLYWFHADPAPRIMLKSSLPWFDVQCSVSTAKVVACVLSIPPSFFCRWSWWHPAIHCTCKTFCHRSLPVDTSARAFAWDSRYWKANMPTRWVGRALTAKMRSICSFPLHRHEGWDLSHLM